MGNVQVYEYLRNVKCVFYYPIKLFGVGKFIGVVRPQDL